VDAPVSFVDFAPTVLSLAGASAPKYFQGRAFAGPKKAAQPDEYAFSHRDRMDERYDLVRTARDKRFRYIRNYRPDLPWGQHVQYMFQQKGYRAWERLHKAGKLNEVQERFWHEKPAEELYGAVDDALRCLRRVHLRHRDARAVGTAPLAIRLDTDDLGLILLPRGAKDEETSGVELRRHVGERRLRELELGDGLSELRA